MRIMHNLKRRLYFLALFFLIFSPHILIFGVVIKTVYFFILVPGIMGMYYYFNNRKKKYYRKKYTFIYVFRAYLLYPDLWL
jgi:hypothetical protein